MKVVHVLASVSTWWGGPPHVVRDLTRELGGLGVENVVVGLRKRGSFAVRFSEGTKLVECGPAAVPRLAVPASMDLARNLLRELKSADLVHIHELWHLPHVETALLARVLELPYVITPHGELQPQALSRHRYLKAIAWRFYERRILANCSGIHTLTTSERDAFEAFSPGIRTVVIPNGVDLERIDRALDVAPSLRKIDRRVSEPYLLFVGRLAPEKNLQLLLEAFSIVHEELRDLSLILVGPDEFGLSAALEKQARALGISQRVRYLGTMDEPNKYRLFSSARAFVLSSISEGLSVSLLEALACGTPAIITTGCNFPEVDDAGAGRVVKPIPWDFAQAIQDTLRDNEVHDRMKGNARKLVSSQFSLRSMATKMLGFYREILTSHPKAVR